MHSKIKALILKKSGCTTFFIANMLIIDDADVHKVQPISQELLNKTDDSETLNNKIKEMTSKRLLI
jgi:hypothetical protein